jgi:hypothetical protein
MSPSGDMPDGYGRDRRAAPGGDVRAFVRPETAHFTGSFSTLLAP